MARGIGLRPNWDEHDAATYPIINYFSDRYNTAHIITKKIGKTCYFCNTCKNCNRLMEYKAELKKKWDFGHFWTFDPEWSIKNRVFSMKVVV